MIMKKFGKLSIFMVLLGLVVFNFSGCAPKAIGKTESTASILNAYSKKELPEGFYWNFGIGSNYTEAMKDAVKSLAFMRPINIQIEVYTMATKAYKWEDGKRIEINFDPEKLVGVKPYNIFVSDSYCKVVENWDIPGGILIIRKCPDLQWFKDNGIYFTKIKDYE